jgi:coenzyme F420 hydrogenase subunit beta
MTRGREPENGSYMKTSKSIAEVVTSGLCIGCGLCEAVTEGRVKMVEKQSGSIRPSPLNEFSADEEALLLNTCPGVKVEPRNKNMPYNNTVWGNYSELAYAWAGNADIRFRAATGGVLTALAVHLIKAKQVSFVLHIGADLERPMRNRWLMSDTTEAVIANAGSRYGPVAPLAGFIKALDRNQPFAIVAKPCDLNAVAAFAKSDPRVDKLCLYRLAMVCGGQSKLKKSTALLNEYGVEEDELSVFRYRGYGNPGRNRVETKDGRVFEKTYLELWEDEAGWEIETRCKFCPDPLGEAADVAALDVWPGGSPEIEDAGFNGIVVRSNAGESLVSSSVKANDLVFGETLTPEQLDVFQPHQVAKKTKLLARYAGLLEAGSIAIETTGLRLEALGERLSAEARQTEQKNTLDRANQGRFFETD